MFLKKDIIENANNIIHNYQKNKDEISKLIDTCYEQSLYFWYLSEIFTFFNKTKTIHMIIDILKISEKHFNMKYIETCDSIAFIIDSYTVFKMKKRKTDEKKDCKYLLPLNMFVFCLLGIKKTTKEIYDICLNNNLVYEDLKFFNYNQVIEENDKIYKHIFESGIDFYKKTMGNFCNEAMDILKDKIGLENVNNAYQEVKNLDFHQYIYMWDVELDEN